MSKQRSSDLLRLETEGNNGFTSSLLLKPHVDGIELGAERKTFKVLPSSVLGTVKAFLPKLAAANCDLEKTLQITPASSVDIENTDDCTGKVIEMNLALVEQEDSDGEVSSESGCEVDDSDSDTSDSDSDSDVDSQAVTAGYLGEVTESSLKMPCKKEQNRPHIVVLSDTNIDKSECCQSPNDLQEKPG